MIGESGFIEEVLNIDGEGSFEGDIIASVAPCRGTYDYVDVAHSSFQFEKRGVAHHFPDFCNINLEVSKSKISGEPMVFSSSPTIERGIVLYAFHKYFRCTLHPDGEKRGEILTALSTTLALNWPSAAINTEGSFNNWLSTMTLRNQLLSKFSLSFLLLNYFRRDEVVDREGTNDDS